MSMAPITGSSALNYQLPPTPPPLDGLSDAVQAYINQLHNSVTIMQGQIAAQSGTLSVVFSEAVAFGAMVNLYANAGVINARNANAGTGGSSGACQPCHGFCASTSGVAAGATGYVQRSQGLVSGLSGLTVGHDYWLAPVNGGVQTTPDTAAGALEQHVGVALTSTTLSFNVTTFIQH